MSQALHFVPRMPVDVAYPKDSIIVCLNCGKPLYRLQQSLYVGEPLAKSAWKYAPIEVADIVALMDRSDLEPGQRAALKALSLDDWRLHCDKLTTLKPGDFSDCVSCQESFVFGKITRDDEGSSRFGDKGYVVKLATIPPQGQAKRHRA